MLTALFSAPLDSGGLPSVVPPAIDFEQSGQLCVRFLGFVSDRKEQLRPTNLAFSFKNEGIGGHISSPILGYLLREKWVWLLFLSVSSNLVQLLGVYHPKNGLVTLPYSE